jgi:hypothetical protein
MQRLLFLVFLLSVGSAYALSNPASVYCNHHAGIVSVGGELAGICLFPDHSYCEEWSFFRGICKPGEYFLPQKLVGTHYCIEHRLRKKSIIYLCKAK